MSTPSDGSSRRSNRVRPSPCISNVAEAATSMSSLVPPIPSDSGDLATTGALPPLVYPPRPVVLVIDDEPGVRDSLRFILKDDFEVLEAADGASGLEIIRSRRVDVALLDVRMPGEPGPAGLPPVLPPSEAISLLLITPGAPRPTAAAALKTGASRHH